MGLTLQFLGSSAVADADRALANRRLVVVICRGGMDGLSVSPPVGDPHYAALRGVIAIPPSGQPGGALRLDDTFGLHPALEKVHALALAGEARIAPAVATPDRERSHFEAQDVLESGGPVVFGTGSGWLNRAMEAMGPAAGKVRGLSLGPTTPLLLRGKMEAISWSPGIPSGHDARLPAILQDLYAGDPLLGPAFAAGLATQSMAGAATAMAQADSPPPAPAPTPALTPPKGGRSGAISQARQQGATLAGFMSQPGGPTIAGLELDGFDTHANQGAAEGALAVRLAQLDAFLDGLQTGLAAKDLWRGTAVIVATEFGRTARVNGTNGTDHGTASTALLLGGALRRGGIIGDWPTLADNRLYESRDTSPTLDMRGLFKGVLRDHLGIERARLDSLVFPESAAVPPASGLIA